MKLNPDDRDLGYSDLLLNPSLDDSERVSSIQTIRRNGEHLLTIINDILDISKIEAGKMTVERIETSPIEILADVHSLMRQKTSEKISHSSLNLRGCPEHITTDPTRLRQMLVNLIGNAIKLLRPVGSPLQQLLTSQPVAFLLGSKIPVSG